MVDYSKFANIDDSDDEDVKSKPKPYVYAAEDNTFKADMTWSNDEATATLVLRVPDLCRSDNDFTALFHNQSLELEIFNPPIGKISLSCPAIVPSKCEAALHQLTTKEVKESRDQRMSRCIRISLIKLDEGLWPSDTFGGTPGASTGVGSSASNGKGASSAPPAAAAAAPAPSKAGVDAAATLSSSTSSSSSSSSSPQTGSLGWRHVDKRLDVWMTFPKETTRKELKVETTPTQLKVTVMVDGKPLQFERRWWQKVDPDELTWELESEGGPTDAPDFLRKPGVRLLRIEVDMAELERWETVFAE
jgi:hypothetical protein